MRGEIVIPGPGKPRIWPRCRSACRNRPCRPRPGRAWAGGCGCIGRQSPFSTQLMAALPGLRRTSADFVCAAALRPGHKTAVSRVSCDREQFLRYPKRSPRYLLVVLEKGDDVLDVLRLGDAAERHAVALHLALRVADIGLEIGFVPDEVRARHRVRIAIIVERAGLAAEHAMEAGAERVGAVVVTSHASLEQDLAMTGVGRRRRRQNERSEARADRR